MFEILSRKVVDSDGKYAGRLEDVEVERGDEVSLIKSYLVVHRGLIGRIQTWALSASIQASIPVTEKSRPYRVPWDQMDMSDPEHPRILVPQAELSRVRSGAL